MLNLQYHLVSVGPVELAPGTDDYKVLLNTFHSFSCLDHNPREVRLFFRNCFALIWGYLDIFLWRTTTTKNITNMHSVMIFMKSYVTSGVNWKVMWSHCHSHVVNDWLIEIFSSLKLWCNDSVKDDQLSAGELTKKKKWFLQSKIYITMFLSSEELCSLKRKFYFLKAIYSEDVFNINLK